MTWLRKGGYLRKEDITEADINRLWAIYMHCRDIIHCFHGSPQTWEQVVEIIKRLEKE